MTKGRPKDIYKHDTSLRYNRRPIKKDWSYIFEKYITVQFWIQQNKQPINIKFKQIPVISKKKM